MKILCAPKSFNFSSLPNQDLKVILYGRRENQCWGDTGNLIWQHIRQKKLRPHIRAWDLLSIALSVIAADLAGHRKESPDGWTRQFELTIAISDPDFWNAQNELLNKLLGFLTTDIWKLTFAQGGFAPNFQGPKIFPSEDSVALLSGGLDSLIGLLDLDASRIKPYTVSQIVIGDAEKQRNFTRTIGGGLNHLQLNHNSRIPRAETPSTQRARSIIFLAYGVLLATCLKTYQDGNLVTLYVCENGFISMNPPLTGARLGSLSTRTTNPVFLQGIQNLLTTAGLNVHVKNPYQFKTKGEMLKECKNQNFLRRHAHETTSCGRYRIFGYEHCGRCIPCLIRRAAFKAWGKKDLTEYVYDDLSLDNSDHARFDDVRSAGMALANVRKNGIDAWLSGNVNSTLLGKVNHYKDVINRGLEELRIFLKKYKIR